MKRKTATGILEVSKSGSEFQQKKITKANLLNMNIKFKNKSPSLF